MKTVLLFIMSYWIIGCQLDNSIDDCTEKPKYIIVNKTDNILKNVYMCWYTGTNCSDTISSIAINDSVEFNLTLKHYEGSFTAIGTIDSIAIQKNGGYITGKCASSETHIVFDSVYTKWDPPTLLQ